jgi:hypothetical protein
MLPVACTLDDSEMARRRADLRTGVLSEAQHVQPLANGYQWRFSSAPNLCTRLAAVIDAERHCCPFLTFDIRAGPDAGDIQLTVTGPEGTVEFLADWLP